MSTLIIAPSRGRPQKAVELLTSFRETKSQLATHLVVVVDDDDQKRDEYLDLIPSEFIEINETIGSMNLALNAAATMHAAIGIYDYLGFVGDDHRFRTPDWDVTFEKFLNEKGGGFAYGNDLYQKANLPTHIVMNAAIVDRLGWMGLPTCKHLYLDDTWKYLGSAVNRLFYFPEVIVEHMHVYAGKAEMDEGYERVNSREIDAHDHKAFTEWTLGKAHADIELVRQALGL